MKKKLINLIIVLFLIIILLAPTGYSKQNSINTEIGDGIYNNEETQVEDLALELKENAKTGKIILIVILLFFITCVVLFFIVMNKAKHKNIISKIFVLLIIGIAFYKTYNGAFEQINLGITNGALFLGLSWGSIIAVWQKHFINTVEIYFGSCIAGWLGSFVIACLEFGSIPFESSMRIAVLIGLGISAISTIFSEGEPFSFDSDNYEDYTSGTTPTTHKKIRATTINYGKGLSETTYRDEDGNKTTIEHWKF